MAWFCGYGQTTVFKGQVLNNNSVVKNYTIIINGKPATTDDSGVFTTAISSSASQLTIQPSDKNYIIAYPTSGRVLVPKDASLLTQIVLEGFQSNGQIKSYLASLTQLKDAAKKGQSETKALQVKIDSIAANLKKSGYTNDDLRIAREKQDGIDLFYPEISSTLQNYILQAQSLMAAFKFIGVYAFVNVNALTQYVQNQNGYNQASNKLYVNYPIYSKKIADYWDDPSLSASFEGIADTLIYGIGKNQILPLNDLKDQINSYFQKQIPDKDKEKVKKDIQSQIAEKVPGITDQLNVMELRVKQFLSRLKN
jgi:CII-binding regulator of phage lambda lysogenization HflD